MGKEHDEIDRKTDRHTPETLILESQLANVEPGSLKWEAFQAAAQFQKATVKLRLARAEGHLQLQREAEQERSSVRETTL